MVTPALPHMRTPRINEERFGLRHKDPSLVGWSRGFGSFAGSRTLKEEMRSTRKDPGLSYSHRFRRGRSLRLLHPQ